MTIKTIKQISSFKRLFLFGLLFLFGTQAYSAEHCSDTYYIDVTLPNQSRWDMCWEHRDREGIILHHVFYTPKNGTRQQILYQAAIAQIHVPYDDNGARYHDVSDYGIGGRYMNDLKPQECPNGTLKQFSGKNVICQQIEKRHVAHHTSSDSLHGDALSLFSAARIGAYHYIPQWRFFDDGTIEPTMGATGALQRRSNGHTNRGWPTNSNRTGIAHLHNYFWRLDFDLGASGTDDFVEEFNFSLNSGKRERTSTRFLTEKAREISPSNLRSWRIVDGNSTNSNAHTKSYEILLQESGHKDKGPSNEPYTHNDFFVTKAYGCEKYASHNPTSNGCKRNLAEFVNGENISGKDIIVWVGLTFYHMPRVEDEPHMDAHWNHFQIVPRDWHASNPLGNGTGTPVNTPPVISNPGNQTNRVGDNVNLSINATDPDNNPLTYSATGLVPGLNINSSTGNISGTVSTGSEGDHNIIVMANDGIDSSSTSFVWTIDTGHTGGGIQIDGNDTDWTQIRSYQDTPGENTSPVDIETLQVTGNANKVFIAYHDRQNIDPAKSWAWQVLIDSDYQSNTGLLYFDMGGDYMLVGDTIYEYAGDGQSWDWTLIGNVTGAINGKFAELAIDRSILGQSNKLKLTFYGANAFAGGTTNDFLFVNAPNINGDGNTGGGIVIDGLSNDWPANDAISDEPEADTSPVDFQSAWFKQENQKVYFAYTNRTPIDTAKYWAWMILIDSDRQVASGINFYGELGADFMLLGNDLYKYAGSGTDWNWTFIRKVSNVVNNKFSELEVNKSDLDNSNNYKIVFYGSNTYAGGAVDDQVNVFP